MPDQNPGHAVHLIVGPAEHGVVRHGRSIAVACGHPVRWTERPTPIDPVTLNGARVVHIPYTDRLFAADCDRSAEVFTAITAPLTAAGITVSVTLHDLPTADSDWGRRRVAAYSRVVASATGVVVNSPQELRLAAHLGGTPRSVRMIPLPVEPPPTEPLPDPKDSTASVVVLGFVFPDRGYEHTIDELPAGVGLLALGRPSEGHEDLPGLLAARAAARGSAFSTTGFVPDAELPTALRTAGVPVAPNRRVTASASINTWLSSGRRPLVPDMPYSRELLRRWPGTLTLYDPDEPGDLRAAVQRAITDPASTWLSEGTAPGPSLPDVAAEYRHHFAGCQPAGLISVGVERWAFPDNRWDLLDGLTPRDAPAVSVVIPYFEAQHDLDLVLTGLAQQHHPAARLQVVVADDGSARPPELHAAGDLDVVLVRQPDQGFRAAAARNLGVAAADGEVLLFLDGDTVPEPDYVGRLARLPALAPDALVVGRRRHADLADWTPERLADWLTATDRSETTGPTELPEPGWLLDAYRETDNLLRADARSYRHVISAVLGLHRRLFDEIGGFCEEFTAYGGEDWELANRAWVAGAGFAHIRDAVGWHIGADWAGRTGDARQSKNAETLALARWLPDPVARGGGQWLPYPAIVVRLPATDAAGAMITARTAFGSGADCGIWLTGDAAAEIAATLGDPRIRSGEPTADITGRALVVVDLTGPCRLDLLPQWSSDAQRLGELNTPAGRFAAHRAIRRTRRWATPGVDPALLQAVLFGGQDRPDPTPTTDIDLAHELPRSRPVGQPVSRS